MNGTGVLLSGSLNDRSPTNFTACNYIISKFIPVVQVVSYNGLFFLEIKGRGLRNLMMKDDVVSVYNNPFYKSASFKLYGHVIAHIVSILPMESEVLFITSTYIQMSMPRVGSKLMFKNGTNTISMVISNNASTFANVSRINGSFISASVPLNVGSIVVGGSITFYDCADTSIHGVHNVTHLKEEGSSYLLLFNVPYLRMDVTLNSYFDVCNVMLNNYVYAKVENHSLSGITQCSDNNFSKCILLYIHLCQNKL
jgi:hypothetical protein